MTNAPSAETQKKKQPGRNDRNRILLEVDVKRQLAVKM